MTKVFYLRKILVLVSCAILLITFSKPTNAKTIQEIARKAFRSTVLLVLEDGSGQPISLGSGFIVQNGKIASNLHVVEGASRGYAKIVGQKTKYNIEGITGIDTELDLVILKISASQTTSLSIGDSDKVEVGDSVFAIGNPQGLEGTFSQGIVSSIRNIGSDKLLQITAQISPGSSGGPVLNSKGEVIGVSVATFRDGQNLNFAIPSNYLSALMSKTGSLKPLTSKRHSKTKRSIFADMGEKSADGVVGTQLAWALPDNPFGSDYSFSLRNQLRSNVKNIYCLVVFFDLQRNPIDVDVVRYRGMIPAGLAKRITSRVDPSIGVLTKWKNSAVEFRILDFQIVE